MNEEIKRLGTAFKAKRKELNFSLKEVENTTSIRSLYLEAIEEGKVQQFLSPVYVQGFTKQYAAFLGLDIDALAREYPHAFRMPTEKHDFSYGIGTLEVRGSMGGGVKWLPNLIWAGVASAIIVMAWYLAKFLGVI